MSSDLLGQTLGSRYHFEEQLGEGTFARVYRITDLQRRAVLAAKVLRSDIAHDPSFVERFRREADVLARLQHPHIVRYYDIVEIDDTLFILMDFVPGSTLQSVLARRDAPLKPQATLEYFTPLASALHFAHSEGVIHRDLKPANILLHTSGTLFVTDFGIARLLNVSSELTIGMTVGTPTYMSPEQITGEPITTAADIYALGVMLYRMVTGRPPFRGESPGAQGTSTAARVTYEHVHIAPQPPIEVNPHLDLAVQDVVLRCLEKTPDQRFASVSDLHDALAEATGAPPMSLDSTGAIDSAAPPDMKLPEWSQFMTPVYEGDTPALSEIEPIVPDDDDEYEETLAPARRLPPDRIQHPIPQPETEPHLEDKLRPAGSPYAGPAPATPSRALPTLTSLGRMLRSGQPTPQASPGYAPPPAYTAPRAAAPPRAYAAPPRRRNWWLIAIMTGTVLILATLCVAVIYIAETFDNPTQSTRVPTATTVAEQITPAPSGGGGETPAPVAEAGGTRIAFDSRRSGTLDIYTMNVDGSDLVPLTGTSGAERGPSWSPDGAQIAFYGASSETGNYDIFTINLDGTGLQNLTNSPDTDDRYPAWSPDGTQIVFHSNLDGDFDLYTINPDGSGLRAITNNSAQDLGPDWSPDGTQIAFHTDVWGYPYEIAVLDLATLQVRRLTDNDDTNSFPTWSPDVTRLAFHAISAADGSVNILILPTDGSPAEQITFGESRNAFPDWSPDGTQILYQSGQPGISAIYSVSVQGGTSQALTGTQTNFLPEWEPYYSP